MEDWIKRARRDWSPSADSHHIVGWAEQYAEPLLSLAEAQSSALVVARDALEGIIPRNLCLTNKNIRDVMIVPLETTMGELRQVANALAQLNALEENDSGIG